MSTYRLEWLLPRHARQVARLGRRVHDDPQQRFGLEDIRATLAGAEQDGSSLSVGAFDGGRLVAYLLAFVGTLPVRLARGTPIATQAPAGSIYVADFAAHPRHRGAASALGTRLSNLVRQRPQLRTAPIRALCREDCVERWLARTRFFARLGYRPETNAAPGAEARSLFRTLTFEPRPDSSRRAVTLPQALKARRVVLTANGARTVGLIDCASGWDLLEPWWNSLLERTPRATMFQSYEYLRTWWRHFGLAGRPWIVVVLEGDVPIALAPLQIASTNWLGRELRCLTFLGQASEIDRPTVFAQPEDAASVRLMLDCIFARADEWDCLVLHEQFADSAFQEAMRTRLADHGYVHTEAEGPLCTRVDVAGDWSRYLASRPRALRKSIKRKIARLASRNSLALDTVETNPQQALERYLHIERSSWKPGAGLGVAKSSTHLSFYRELIEHGGSLRPRFSFLRSGEETLAASFGMSWNERFFSLHIAHDARRAEDSPGFVLTALELEQVFARGGCREFDFLGGFLTNKRGWSTTITPTVALYADRPTLRGHLFHWLYFRLKPALKGTLRRVGLLAPLLAAKKVLARRIRGLDTWT